MPLLLAIAVAAPAAACEAQIDTRDNRIPVASDGSFTDANIADPSAFLLGYPSDQPVDIPSFEGLHHMASGNPARDRGNGRIAQKIIFSNHGCEGREALLFVDCNGPEAFLIFGEAPSGDKVSPAVQSWTFIAEIQPPLGPVSIRATSTVEDLARTARQGEGGYPIAPATLFAGSPRRDRYAIVTGCRILYPDLPGANG